LVIPTRPEGQKIMGQFVGCLEGYRGSLRNARLPGRSGQTCLAYNEDPISWRRIGAAAHLATHLDFGGRRPCSLISPKNPGHVGVQGPKGRKRFLLIGEDPGMARQVSAGLSADHLRREEGARRPPVDSGGGRKKRNGDLCALALMHVKSRPAPTRPRGALIWIREWRAVDCADRDWTMERTVLS